MSLGIAMLARNAAAGLPRALEPFLGKVDEIAILLGGRSSDNTVEAALTFTNQVTDYQGPVDENGGLLNFGLARQQSFDLLSTDWALLVDCDDTWIGAEHLSDVVRDAAEGDYRGVLFPYDLGGSIFLQTRLFWRSGGYWTCPVHEKWVYHDQPDTKTLSVNAMKIRQEKPPAERTAGIERNIRIAEAALAREFNFRILLHLPNEYLATRQYDKALEAVGVILGGLDRAGPEDTTPDKMFQVHFARGVAHLCLEDFEQAAGAALAALSYAKYGHGWALLAEAAYQMGVYDLTALAADKALAMGRPINTIPTPWSNVSSVPYHLKGKALQAMGRKHEALAAYNLGLALGGSRPMLDEKFDLCNELGVIP